MKMILQTMALPLSCFLFFLALQSHNSVAQTHSNITLGSFLKANNDNTSWISPSGDFAFGFQQIEDKGFLLAVWFDKIPEKTIVWSANQGNLVQKGSIIQLTKDGQFLLNDPKGQKKWSATFVGSLYYAAMLDTGNFVLASQDSVNLWETFDNPTDTILPTQTLSLGAHLVARFSETNYSNGRFLFAMQGDGNLVLYTTSFLGDQAAYWSTETEGIGFQVVFNQSGYIYLKAKNTTILNYLSDAAPPSNFYQRAILKHDGVFRHYVYPKPSGSGASRWPAAWSTVSLIPENICLSTPSSGGRGICGLNSYCSLGSDQSPTCQCPPGYTIIDPHDERSGCRPIFISQSCEGPSQDADLFDLMEMPNTRWPGDGHDYAHYYKVTEDWCRGICLRDCLCTVAVFEDGNCWMKKFPFSNGRLDDSLGGKTLIKILKDNSTLQGVNSKNNDDSTLIITGAVLLGGSAFINIVLLLATSLTYFYFKNRRSKVLHQQRVTLGMNLQSFSYKELEHATCGFKEEIDHGAFATVYKGELPNERGNFVAVKNLEKFVKEGEKEFETEVLAIGRTNHKNLVQLLGFCNEGHHRLLVYKLMSNRSLANFLFGNPWLDWCTRVQIAFGVSRGLCYLHEECSTQIIHCNIKPQNILLDDLFNAKISDFGLAKLLSADQTRTTTGIRGTKGYVAPEWFKNMPITAKVDVYSFGILLLELLFCRKSLEAESNDENMVILAEWAYDCYIDRRLDLLLQNDEAAMHDMKHLERFVMVAIWCIQEDPSLRPPMRKVTQMLEGAVEVPAPPDPSSYISSI